MRVVLVLGADDLTTKQIHERLPDVAQASLYRAVARLVNAGIITVVERHRRGGAMERVYRVAATPEAATASATPEEFVAATETVARSLSLDAARHAAAGEWHPRSAGLLRENVHLTREQFELLRREVVEFIGELVSVTAQDDTEEFSLTIAAIPRSTPPNYGSTSFNGV